MNGAVAIEKGRRNRLRPLMGRGRGPLALPALAMWRPRPGVEWTRFDFIAMGVLLALACGVYELGAWLNGNNVVPARVSASRRSPDCSRSGHLAVACSAARRQRQLMLAGVLFIRGRRALARIQASGLWRGMIAAAWRSAAVGVGVWMGEFDPRGNHVRDVALPGGVGALFRKATEDQRVTQPAR